MNDFSVWVGIGAVLGLWRLAASVHQRQTGVWVNLGLFSLLLALLGARGFYAWLNWGYFAERWLEVPQFWLGGLAWPGAVLGTWLALILLSLRFRAPLGQRVSLAQFGDRLYPLLPPLAITTWIGCWQAGFAYGPMLPEGTWWGIPVLDESGTYALRWPLQPAAALGLLAFFAVLEARVKPLQPAGLLTSLSHAGLLLNLLAVSLLRADPVPTWQGLRIETWMALLFLVCLIILTGVNLLTPRVRGKPSYSNP